MKPPVSSGKRIKELRLQQGRSQRWLSTSTATYAYISRLESGQRVPSWSVLIDLARKLGTTALYLAYGTEARRCPVCGRGPEGCRNPP
jgi:transcriptional regulator with XRE-family HTH domain